jgi:hypothetical protein
MLRIEQVDAERVDNSLTDFCKVLDKAFKDEMTESANILSTGAN